MTELFENESPVENPHVLFTWGYSSNRTPGDLLALVEQNHISLVIDVRSVPRSRWNHSFDRPELEKLFADYPSCRYEWRGDVLGGAVKDKTSWIAEAVGIARDLKHGSVLLLCCERDPAECHRSEIADLVDFGNDDLESPAVIHL